MQIGEKRREKESSDRKQEKIILAGTKMYYVT